MNAKDFKTQVIAELDKVINTKSNLPYFTQVKIKNGTIHFIWDLKEIL